MLSSAGRWLTEARTVLERIEQSQMGAISAAAERCAETISSDGLVHLFGTGHSRIALEEMFPRYGSYPGFHPIAELSMTFHTQVVGSNGQRQAMFIERTEGLAEQILANFHFGPADAMIVFSVGGLSAVTLEMAIGARDRGMTVIAVTSLAESTAAAPRHPTGTRLADHADIVIDLCTPVGDAMVTIDGLTSPVGPGSTLAYAAVVNEIKVQTAEILVGVHRMPPVITSPTVAGPVEAARLFEAAYADHAKALARALSP
jgi:uncharacterized phosphosugar-binding protein